MPPTMGAAMRRMTSDPVPPPSMIGNNPPMMAATVMTLGRTRRSAPSTTASIKSCRVMLRPSPSACCSRRVYARSKNTSITTAVSAATPASAMNPMALATDRW